MSSVTVTQFKLGAYEKASLLLMKTVTPLHIGVGRVTGVVDLPIIRDALGFPVIPTSSLKGALRSQLSEALNKEEIRVFFGPEPGDEEAYMGALAFTEGYLLAIPVRSVRGIWALATSPVLINRFLKMIQMMQSLEPSAKEHEELCEELLKEGESMGVDQALLCEEGEKKLSIEIMDKRSIIINEEFQFECKQSKNIREFFESIRVSEPWRGILLHDDMIRDVVERSIPRRSRIRLKKAEKIVEEGGLWSEEDLPAETFFFTILLYSKPRKPDEKIKDVDGVKGKIINLLLSDVKQKRGYAIFGGHETIGRGVVELIGLAGCSL